MLKGVEMLKTTSTSLADQGMGKLILMFAAEMKIMGINLFSWSTSIGLLPVNSSVFWGLQLRTALC